MDLKKGHCLITTYFLCSQIISEITEIQLLEGKKYGLSIGFKDKVILAELESANSTLGFFSYLQFCLSNTKQEDQSLWENIRENADIVFNQYRAIYFDDIINALLKARQKGLTDENLILEIELEHITYLFKRLLISFFALNNRNEKQLMRLASHMNNLFIESLKKKIEQKLEPLVIHECMRRLLLHEEVLKEFNLMDSRFTIATKLVLNIYKRLFFNSITNILNNILDKLKDPNYMVDGSGATFYAPFIDFFKEIRNFMIELIPLRTASCFCSITIDFKRKLFYYFFGHFKMIIDQNLAQLPYKSLLVMLDGVFYLTKENDRMISDFRVTFNEGNEHLKYLMNFRKQYFVIGESIVNQLRVIISDKIKTNLEKAQLKEFDIGRILRKDLAELYEPLEKTHSYYMMRLLRFILIKILEKYLQLVQVQNPNYLSLPDFEEDLKEVKSFFTGDSSGQNLENYVKFLDYYAKFLNSKNENTCQSAIAMMKMILSEEISDETCKLIIATKNYSKSKFSQKDMVNYYTSLLADQQKGNKLIQKRQDSKRKAARNLFVIKVVFQFIFIMKRIKHFNLRYQESEVKVQESFDSLNRKLEVAGIKKYSTNVKMLFIKRQEFEDLDEAKITEMVRQISVTSPPFDYLLSYDNNKLLVQDTKGKLVKVLRPCKFIKIEKTVMNGFKTVLLTYKQFEKILVMTKKVEKQEKIFSQLSSIIQAFKNLTFNSKP